MSQKLTPGLYEGVVRSGLLSEDDKGKPFVAFVCDVLAQAGGARLAAPLTRTVRRYLTENAAEYTIKDLRNLGWAGSDFGELEAGHERQHDFAGTPCRLLLKYRPYNGPDAGKAGTDVEDWEFRMGGGLVQAKPAAQATVAMLNATLRAKLAAAPAAPRPQQRQAPARQDEPHADGGYDSIPF